MMVGKRAPGGPLDYLLATLTTMPTECTTWPYSGTPAGYGQVWEGGRMRVVSNVVCEWYHGPRPDGLECCHSCGNGHRGCFNPRHLRWDTHSANVREANRVGMKGSRAKLTDEQVLDIRARHAAGEHYRALAAEYGIGVSTLYSIVERRSWGHI